MELNEIMGILNSPNGLKQVMMQPAFQNEGTGHEFSQADLIADVINILRMDTKRIADAHGLDVEIDRMTPDRAAELLQGVAEGEDLGLVEIFDEIEDQRMMILAHLEGEDEMEQYLEMKQSMLYTVPDDPQEADQ
jgi:hypothetical protein